MCRAFMKSKIRRERLKQSRIRIVERSPYYIDPRQAISQMRVNVVGNLSTEVGNVITRTRSDCYPPIA